MTTVLLTCIRAYQRISRALIALGFGPFARSGCRQWPTCSEYGMSAIAQHGPIRGVAKAVIRVAHCHPLA